MLAKSIKSQVILVLIVQIGALLAIVVSTLYLLNLRQHDYLILNLTGQLRVISQTMANQSSHYASSAPRDYASYDRDLGLYNADLQMQIKSFDRIIQSLKDRTIKAELISNPFITDTANNKPEVASFVNPDEVIHCTWNKESRNQLAITVDVWQKFYQGLMQALGPDKKAPRLEYAAQYIVKNEQALSFNTNKLSSAFRSMMEYKLNQINILNQSSIIILIIISATIIFILYQRIFRPIERTVAGFNRVAHGDLKYQIPVEGTDEIGVMSSTFNRLTQRLSSLFQLTDRINQATNLDETLRYVYEEFPAFLPIDWVGIIRTSRNFDSYQLERCYTRHENNINQREQFNYYGSVFEQTIMSGEPFCSCITQARDIAWQDDHFIQSLQKDHLKSFFFMPLLSNKLETVVLVFASQTIGSYTQEHLEFLTNIASQIGHSFEKTIGMESLVISAVKGLAKLAESRDPETGDHLYRMSRYSALVAEELGKSVKYQHMIDSIYVRNVFRFAPMHDIGKVGISDDILLKPGRLDDAEMKLMRRHPIVGGEVLRRCEQQMNAVGHSVFKTGIEIAESHHEKFDGSGYPNGLSGNDIPLSARIVAIADVFDALTSKRPYKEAWPIDKAVNLLHDENGKHFDPDVVAAFDRAMPRILDIYEKHKHV